MRSALETTVLFCVSAVLAVAIAEGRRGVVLGGDADVAAFCVEDDDEPARVGFEGDGFQRRQADRAVTLEARGLELHARHVGGDGV